MSPRVLGVAVALAGFALAPGASLAASASLTDIENDVMCVSCHEPLAVAQSPQSYAERAFIRSLIARGETKAQIERQLVAQYGPAVLGRPPADGFNLTVYVLPPALLVLGIVTLALILPRWRRRSPTPTAATPKRLEASEERRLEEELSRYGG